MAELVLRWLAVLHDQSMNLGPAVFFQITIL
jgi:hypothetical protein